MGQPVRPHTIKLHTTKAQPTGQQEGRNSTTTPQEHQGYTSRIMYNQIHTMEDYTPKQAITHHGNISPTTKQ